ncbi:hypothetical protein FT663_04248 [Candidozyma haemuli var. vulneris]|uniref:Uncharacterized protein n=1 Tax=Candidozyma haemuli TaxID=45357 RepID=A0A2V1ASF5_9ASCO|nr:hypothetical protein CXQ85_004158 [[Candida] haemuloni]KAF3987902.1 hypothetical protein FT662_03733 [[Candida] haemuloni var. vulneris]KAF3987910.1 hypothetical protein FT663_04248 [[Candida] haemuloni var. vulneris]PVH20654.1 hypothetical protein CXQ85_004158 [[Candida] haemuloni]
MKLSNTLLAATAAVAGVSAADSSITVTMTFTDNDRTYTKTRTDPYTGQATTLPTDGTHLTTFTLANDDYTATISMTNTYGKETTVTSSDIIVGPEETYTRQTTLQMHTTQVSSYLDWLSSKNAAAQSRIDGHSETSDTTSTSATAEATTDETTSATGGAVKYSVGSAALGVAAIMLL